jgi:hypothetical protein
VGCNAAKHINTHVPHTDTFTGGEKRRRGRGGKGRRAHTTQQQLVQCMAQTNNCGDQNTTSVGMGWMGVEKE